MIGNIQDIPVKLSEIDSRDIAHYLQNLRENRRGKFFAYFKDIEGIDMLPRRA